MIPPTYADRPPVAYTSTLIDGFVPRADRQGFLYIPSNWTEPDLWEIGKTINRSSNAPLSALQEAIQALQCDEEDDSPPTDYAFGQVLSLCTDATTLLGHRWRKPRVATDGFGGLRLSWKANDKELRAIVGDQEDKERYLYWEEKEKYGAERNFTGVTLFSYLDSLLQGKPFPQ